MRISETEKSNIITLSRQIFGKDAKIFLFGSRVDDNKSGGDIDIYIKISRIITTESKLKNIIALEVALINQIGDQKYDIIINDGSDHKLIYDIAEQQGIELC